MGLESLVDSSLLCCKVEFLDQSYLGHVSIMIYLSLLVSVISSFEIFMIFFLNLLDFIKPCDLVTFLPLPMNVGLVVSWPRYFMVRIFGVVGSLSTLFLWDAVSLLCNYEYYFWIIFILVYIVYALLLMFSSLDLCDEWCEFISWNGANFASGERHAPNCDGIFEAPFLCPNYDVLL